MGTFGVHPEMTVLIDAAAAMPVADSIAEFRAVWTRYARAMGKPHPKNMSVEGRRIAAKGIEVPVRVYRPSEAAGCAPAIVYLHGGGFVTGDLDTADTIAWGFAEGTGGVVVSVDYRLAPEHPFPAAVDDGYAVTAHLATDGAALGIDPRRIALAGDSAGGTLAAAVALAARDRRGPPLAAQVLIYPALGVDFTLPSYVENANAPLLAAERIRWYWELYLGGKAESSDPYATPLAAGDVSGLPPAFVHTAQYDPLRDDGACYAERLRAAGVACEYRCARRMIHGFLRARFQGAASAGEFAAACGFLRRHLGLA